VNRASLIEDQKPVWWLKKKNISLPAKSSLGVKVKYGYHLQGNYGNKSSNVEPAAQHPKGGLFMRVIISIEEVIEKICRIPCIS
jgi:hypothetical protein